MKSLTWLHESMLNDISMRCGTDTHLDTRTVKRRTKHEGQSFLTITLPDYCKSFEQALCDGQVGPSHFLGFKRRAALPVFLRGLLVQVFDPVSGSLLLDPNHDCIFAIRQVCLIMKKISLPCSSYRVQKTIDSFKKIEHELSGATARVTSESYDRFCKVSDILWSETLAPLSFSIEEGSLIPRHGPGSTAEKRFGNDKYRILTWNNRLESSFPITWFGHTSLGHEPDSDPFQDVEFVEPGAEVPVRVTTVPKTLTGPRVIALEPTVMQYCQQSLLARYVKILEIAKLTAGHINFTDQSINRDLAASSSVSGVFATVDMKDASDRVHKDFVYRMLSSVPIVRDATFACRTHSALLPDGSLVHLNKFASMGSALCFPVESMLFYTICICARLHHARLPVTRRNIQDMCRRIYVYGDDIIVPVDEVSAVSRYLEEFSLQVNAHKSFWTGKFRESCGMDAYDGTNVTPVYVRCVAPTNRRDASGIVSWVSLANQLYDAGWWGSTQRVREYIEGLLGRRLPYVRETASCLGWINVKDAYTFQRISDDLHRPQVKSFVVRSSTQDDPLDGYHALMKFFLKVGEDPILGEHLERSVRPDSANIKYRWAHPC